MFLGTLVLRSASASRRRRQGMTFSEYMRKAAAAQEHLLTLYNSRNQLYNNRKALAGAKKNNAQDRAVSAKLIRTHRRSGERLYSESVGTISPSLRELGCL